MCIQPASVLILVQHSWRTQASILEDPIPNPRVPLFSALITFPALPTPDMQACGPEVRDTQGYGLIRGEITPRQLPRVRSPPLCTRSRVPQLGISCIGIKALRLHFILFLLCLCVCFFKRSHILWEKTGVSGKGYSKTQNGRLLSSQALG